MVLFSSAIVIIFISCSINTFINTHTHSRHTTFTPSSLYSMEPTPSDSSPAHSSSPDPQGSPHESISFAGTTVTRREDHLKWICRFKLCDTVNCIYKTNCKQCGARRKTPADALDDKGKYIGYLKRVDSSGDEH
ncbi:hypothetical protein FNYG_06574 [Fusarium nygamai]|uniref:RanBP2-type domain-containing protein n=1 Tax=Gibberella nygamai TaxID=42673 RepID=A0A2K0WC80_GIBNY|nr:hypothetical protein FNYG_06574 [Fusarium nygamai]